jgi:integrase
MTALAAETDMAALCLRFLVMTASRSGEARGATWAEIDPVAGLWSLEAGRMKSGRPPHRVPLSEPVLELLQGAAEVRCGDLVFWGRAGMLSDTTLTKALHRLGYDGITVHGMRSCFAQWAQDHGHPPDLIEASLAHQSGSAVARAYQRSDVLERRRALMAQWAAFLTTPPAQVIPLRAAG